MSDANSGPTANEDPLHRKIPPAADLHVHTHYSDGIDSVADLLARADAWFTLLSICDHDTIAAYDDIPDDRLCAEPKLGRASILPGIEVSCRLTDTHEMHLLGYFPSGFTPRFREFASEIAQSRTQRVLEGVRRLREAGVGLRWSEFEQHYSGIGVPCRSHVARALRSTGTVSTNRGAFGRLLTRENFEPAPVDAPTAIRTIREEGGVPVWAHPSPSYAEDHTGALVEHGLLGLEAYTPSRRPGQIRRIRTVAEEFDLIVTGGSDYHGLSSAMPLGKWRFDWEKVPAVLRLGERS